MDIFPKFKKALGPVIESVRVSPETIDSYRGKVPEVLLRLWQEDGWGGYGGGLLWTVDPEYLRPVIKEGLGGGYEEAIAFLRTAFGVIFFWYGGRVYYWDTIHEGRLTERARHIEVLFEVTLVDKEYIEIALDKPLFDESVAKFGQLRFDECWGFVPALSMGGRDTIEGVQKVKLREYLGILNQVRVK